MFDFHEKRKIRGLLYSKVTVVIIFLLAGLLSLSVFERFSVEREMAEKRSEKERELESLRERAAVLESKVQYLQNERGVEEELRNRFDVAKEGEQVIIILDEGDDTRNSSGSESDFGADSSNDTEGRTLLDVLKFW